ncbi:MAG: FHA domain-containing protein [Oscillospiraceae bacterium]
MTRFKLCPYCGRKNPPALLECEQCEADITAVRAVDSEPAEIPAAEPEPQRVRICEDCGFRNVPAARKCTQCGADISYIAPTVGRCIAAEVHYALIADDEFAFDITKPLTVVGREAEMSEYLADKGYVGRKQAKFTLTDDGLYITNLGQTNGTFVNNERLSEAPRKLADGDEIGLGGNSANGKQQLAAYFTVRAWSCF